MIYEPFYYSTFGTSRYYNFLVPRGTKILCAKYGTSRYEMLDGEIAHDLRRMKMN